MPVPPINRPRAGGRRWKELLALGSVGDHANEVFLDAKHLMKTGGVHKTTGELIPGLADNVIADRWLHYLVYAMTMDQTQTSDLTSIQEKAKIMLIAVGETWADQDKLLRKAIILHLSVIGNQILSDQFRDGILDCKKILAFIEKNRIGTSTYSKDKARGRENQVGLSRIVIDRIESSVKPLLTLINKRQAYEERKKEFRTFDASTASPKAVELHARFPGYNPIILIEFLNTPEKFKVFEEWYDKIHANSQD